LGHTRFILCLLDFIDADSQDIIRTQGTTILSALHDAAINLAVDTEKLIFKQNTCAANPKKPLCLQLKLPHSNGLFVR
jgi:hypothetical protein